MRPTGTGRGSTGRSRSRTRRSSGSTAPGRLIRTVVRPTRSTTGRRSRRPGAGRRAGSTRSSSTHSRPPSCTQCRRAARPGGVGREAVPREDERRRCRLQDTGTGWAGSDRSPTGRRVGAAGGLAGVRPRRRVRGRSGARRAAAGRDSHQRVRTGDLAAAVHDGRHRTRSLRAGRTTRSPRRSGRTAGVRRRGGCGRLFGGGADAHPRRHGRAAGHDQVAGELHVRPLGVEDHDAGGEFVRGKVARRRGGCPRPR